MTTAPRYMTGFGNEFESEALPGALPRGQNSPQHCAYGLYAEQLSGTAFTAPSGVNRRSWLYRIRPSVLHALRFSRALHPLWISAPYAEWERQSIGQFRWGPVPIPDEPLNFVSGMRTMTAAGSADLRMGIAAHVYLVTQSMIDAYFYDADGELLIVPQYGSLSFFTELGRLEISPGEICVIPRGIKFKVEPTNGSARGFVCENYGSPFMLPSRGAIGANGLANARNFKTPAADFEDKETPCKLTVKWGGCFFDCALDHSPLDVVAWHGNYAPYTYNLRDFSPLGALRFDHPDPSIFTVLTAPSSEFGPRQCGFRDFSGALASRGTYVSSALAPRQCDERIHGADPGSIRRQARRLRPRRDVAAQYDVAAWARRCRLRAGLERRAETRKTERHARLHVRNAACATSDCLRCEPLHVATRLRGLLVDLAEALRWIARRTG